MKALYDILASSAETMGAFKTSLDADSLHRPTLAAAADLAAEEEPAAAAAVEAAAEEEEGPAVEAAFAAASNPVRFPRRAMA